MFKESILVIEDDVQIQNFMIYTLENAGFSVKGVVNGKDGISYMIKNNVDLILLDLGLPDIDGMQVLRSVMASTRRKIESNPAKPEYIETEIGIGYRMREHDMAK